MKTHIKMISLAGCLSGFSVSDLNQLLMISTKSFWAEGKDICHQGDIGRDMFILCSGKISVWRELNGDRVELAKLGVGESFGEMGLVNNGKRSANASVQEDVLALRINYGRMKEVPSVAAILYKNIATALAGRLTNANDLILFKSNQVPRVDMLTHEPELEPELAMS